MSGEVGVFDKAVSIASTSKDVRSESSNSASAPRSSVGSPPHSLSRFQQSSEEYYRRRMSETILNDDGRVQSPYIPIVTSTPHSNVESSPFSDEISIRSMKRSNSFKERSQLLIHDTASNTPTALTPGTPNFPFLNRDIATTDSESEHRYRSSSFYSNDMENRRESNSSLLLNYNGTGMVGRNSPALMADFSFDNFKSLGNNSMSGNISPVKYSDRKFSFSSEASRGPSIPVTGVMDFPDNALSPLQMPSSYHFGVAGGSIYFADEETDADIHSQSFDPNDVNELDWQQIFEEGAINEMFMEIEYLKSITDAEVMKLINDWNYECKVNPNEEIDKRARGDRKKGIFRSLSWPPSVFSSVHLLSFDRTFQVARRLYQMKVEELLTEDGLRYIVAYLNRMIMEQKMKSVANIEAENRVVQLLYTISPLARAVEYFASSASVLYLSLLNMYLLYRYSIPN